MAEERVGFSLSSPAKSTHSTASIAAGFPSTRTLPLTGTVAFQVSGRFSLQAPQAIEIKNSSEIGRLSRGMNATSASLWDRNGILLGGSQAPEIWLEIANCLPVRPGNQARQGELADARADESNRTIGEHDVSAAGVK